jgi:RNA polymerase sigma factor (sigma-70 family)
VNHALPHPGIAILTTSPQPPAHSRRATESFEARLEAVRPELLVYAKSLMPTGRPTSIPHLDHEDLVQDSLARALTFQANFDEDRPLAPWLKRMLLRLFLDHRKRVLTSPSYFRPGQPVPLAEELSEECKSTPQVLHEDVEEAEFLLAQLEEPERGILDSFYREGLSIAEIGNALSLPAGTVKSHLHRGRLKLREFAQKASRDSTSPDLS